MGADATNDAEEEEEDFGGLMVRLPLFVVIQHLSILVFSLL